MSDGYKSFMREGSVAIRHPSKRTTIIIHPCKKVKYGHKETAEQAARAMNSKTGDEYDAYECRYPPCGAWHIGHS